MVWESTKETMMYSLLNNFSVKKQNVIRKNGLYSIVGADSLALYLLPHHLRLGIMTQMIESNEKKAWIGVE